jgi:polyisoprenoid-binding protein YceI
VALLVNGMQSSGRPGTAPGRRTSLAVPAAALASVGTSRDARGVFDIGRSCRFLVGIAILALGACSSPPRPADGRAAPLPGTAAPAALARYEVTDSEFTVRVFRDGPLARLGHNHVIASTALTGRIELREPVTASVLSLSLPLDSLTVDEPARRREAGGEFPGEVAEPDREGTRRNMLGPAQLDAGRFPALHIESAGIEQAGDGLRITARVSLAGATHEIVVPATVTMDGTTLTARGEFVLSHADLGLTPFSVAFGALRVRDDLHLAYHVRARRAAP